MEKIKIWKIWKIQIYYNVVEESHLPKNELHLIMTAKISFRQFYDWSKVKLRFCTILKLEANVILYQDRPKPKLTNEHDFNKINER